MSFQPSKDSSGRVLKKSVLQGTSSLENTYNVSSGSGLYNSKVYHAEIPTISGATLTTASVGYLDTTAGSAQPGKALILDSSSNIADINSIKCHSITVNGVVIDPNISTENLTPANDYYGSLTPGTAQANKTLVLDSNKNYSGIKTLKSGVTSSSENTTYIGTKTFAHKFSTAASLSKNNWYDCVYSIDLKKYLCIGDNITATSVDGITWEETVQTILFRMVIWAPHKGKFYAIASTGLYSSLDGANWNLQFSNTTLTSVAAGFNIIIVTGASTYYSQYNTTWTQIAAATQTFKSIAFDGVNKFVAVATNVMATTTDIASPVWTNPSTQPTGQWECIAYGNGQFIAVSSATSASGKFTSSTNGTNWSPSLTWITSESELVSGWKKIVFLDGYFYCIPMIPSGQECQIYYTKDSTEWGRFKHDMGNHIASIAWNPMDDKLLLLTRGTQTYGTYAQHLQMKLCNGQYTRLPSAELSYFDNFVSISETGMVFACGPETLYYSSNGRDFKQCYVPYNGGNMFGQIARRIYEVAYSPTLNLYVAASNYSAGVYSQFMRSTDGINWVESSSGNFYVSRVMWSTLYSKFIGMASGLIVYSSDGINWNIAISSGITGLFNMPDGDIGVINSTGIRKLQPDMTSTLIGSNGVGYSRIVLAGSTYYTTSGTTVYSSADLITWTTVQSGLSSPSPPVYHPDFDAVVVFSSNNIVNVYKSGVSSFTLTQVFPVSATNPSYSSVYKCIFTANTINGYTICKTISTESKIALSYKLNKVYRTLPSAAVQLQNIDDAIYTGFYKNTKQHTTPTGSNEVERLFFSRGLGTWYGTKTSPSSSNLTIYTTNSFLTYSNISNTTYYGVHPFNVTPQTTFWLAVDTATNTNMYLTELTQSGSQTGSMLNNFISFSTYSTGGMNKTKKINSRNIIVTRSANIVYFNSFYTSSINGVTNLSYDAALTMTDYAVNDNMDTILLLTTTRRMLNYMIATNVTYRSEVTMPTETYQQLEFFSGPNLYILTSTNTVRYSADGTTWTVITALTGYTYSKWSMNYVPELQIMAIVSTGIFAYSRDGISWTIIPVGSKLWTSFDYSPYHANFLLHCKSDGTVFVASPIFPTLHNIATTSLGYVKDKTLNMWRHTFTPYQDNDTNSYGFEFGQSAMNLFGNSRQIYFSRSADTTFQINCQSNTLKFSSLDNSETAPFRINQKNATMHPDAVFSLSPIYWKNATSTNSTRKTIGLQKNSLLLSRNGNVKLNALTCSSYTPGTLPTDNIAGPVVTDSSKNAKITELGTTELDINGASLKWASPSTFNSRTFTADDYMRLKRTKFSIGNIANNVLGTAYSPDLDTIVILAAANNTTGHDFIYTSKDKGATWVRNNSMQNTGYVSVTPAMKRIIWCSANKMFVLVSGQLWYSPDGFNWSYTSAPLLIGRSYVTYDSKQNRIVTSAVTRLSWCGVADMTSWTVATNATDIFMVEYWPSVDRYLYVTTAAPTTINVTTDIYATTISGSALVTNGTIYSFCIAGSYFYYTNGSAIYRKNTLTVDTGTSVFTQSVGGIRKLVYVSDLSMVVAFGTLGMHYSINGTTWATIPYSHMFMVSPTSSTEGLSNEAFFAGDRMMVTLNYNGELLESDLFNTKQDVSPDYISDIIANRTAVDVLLSSKKENDSLYMKHSSTPRDLYATAYNGSKFVTVGTDVFMYASNLKTTQTFTTHNGAWRDVTFSAGRFVKVGTNAVSFSWTADFPAWTDYSVTGNWFRVLYWNYSFVIASPTAIMYSNNLSSWTDMTPAGIGAINNIKIANGMMFAMSTDKIFYTADYNQSWSSFNLKGTWHDIEYARKLYVLAGDGWMARGRSLSTLRKVFVPKCYHRVIYVRLYSDFFLLSKDKFYDCQSDYLFSNQTNTIIRTTNGIDWTNSLRIGQSGVTQALNISNIYYFEEADQFFMPLNNSTTKIYIVSNHTVANKSLTKITTPGCFTTNRVYSGSYAIDIARGNDLTTTSPSLFNVFQDSAAKPSTSSWLTTSDERLKEDIVDANISICYQNVDSLPLKYYKWKDQYVSPDKSEDRHKLGWIAQEVEQFIPKAVGEVNMFGLEDCKTLNSDQIVANMYGAIQMLIKKIEEKEQAVADAGI